MKGLALFGGLVGLAAAVPTSSGWVKPSSHDRETAAGGEAALAVGTRAGWVDLAIFLFLFFVF
jgi:hypothetical protein